MSAPSAPTVVLVEDDDALRFALTRKLTRRGFVVVEATDAQDALALPAAMYDGAVLVLTDIVMPGISGRDLGRALRARFERLPIVYMSGFVDGSQLGPALDDRERFLEKPFTDADLSRVLVGLGIPG